MSGIRITLDCRGAQLIGTSPEMRIKISISGGVLYGFSLASLYKGKHVSNRVISATFSVIAAWQLFSSKQLLSSQETTGMAGHVCYVFLEKRIQYHVA